MCRYWYEVLGDVRGGRNPRQEHVWSHGFGARRLDEVASRALYNVRAGRW